MKVTTSADIPRIAAEHAARKAPQPGAAAPVDASAAPAANDAPNPDAPASEPKAADPKPDGDKPRNPIQPRINELTKEREDAKRAAEAEKARADAAERRAAELEAKLNPKDPTPAPVEDEAAPDPKDFKDASEWAQAFAEWSRDVARKEIAAENEAKEEARKKQDAENADRTRATAFVAKEQEYAKATPDYAETVAAANFKIADFLADAMIDSDVGPQMRYYFAKNPKELDRLHAMRPHTALTEFGRIENQFMKGGAKANGAAAEANAGSLRAVPRPAEQSRAPAPIDPLKNPGGTVDKPRSQLTYQEWKAARAAGRIK
jgi:hypothetical protein